MSKQNNKTPANTSATTEKGVNHNPAGSSTAPSKSPKNILGITSLVLVIAVGGFFQYRVEMLANKNSALEKHLSLISEHNQSQSQQSGQLSQQLSESKTQMNSMNGQLAFMQHTLNQIPGARLEDWKLAEIEYLLRLANQRINLQKEVAGAGALLNAANQIIAELDDPALLVVREKIAEEMLMLGNASEVDTQGIYARLQALKAVIHNDIQPPSTFTQALSPANKQAEATSTGLMDQILSLISVRTRDAAFDAPLATEQYQLLEHSLLLMLEQAQWALLKGDQTLYEASLDNAKNWIENKLRHKQAENLSFELSAIKAIKITSQLPDISGSLRLLRQIVKDRTYAPSPDKHMEEPAAPVESKTQASNEVKQEQA